MSATRGEIIFIISIISLFIVVMVTFVIIILFFIKKKQKGFTSDLNTIKGNYEKELYKAQMEIQEQTFSEISREIHDNVGQVLSMAKLAIGNLDFNVAEKAKEEAHGVSDMLDKALIDLRDMSQSLNADVIKKRGLIKSIEKQVEFLQRNAGFTTRLVVKGAYTRLTETKEIILFRILQEAVNNIIRHAQASEMEIVLNYQPNALVLSIQDNGKGFNRENNQRAQQVTNGLSNMAYRANLIDSVFEVKTGIHQGTTILVTTGY